MEISKFASQFLRFTLLLVQMYMYLPYGLFHFKHDLQIIPKHITYKRVNYDEMKIPRKQDDINHSPSSGDYVLISVIIGHTMKSVQGKGVIKGKGRGVRKRGEKMRKRDSKRKLATLYQSRLLFLLYLNNVPCCIYQAYFSYCEIRLLQNPNDFSLQILFFMNVMLYNSSTRLI